MERIGRELSASQLDFIKIQHRKNQLAAVGKKRKRSTGEDAEFKKLQRKLDNSRRDMVDFDVRLLFKPPPQSKAQMEAIRKAKTLCNYQCRSQSHETQFWKCFKNWFKCFKWHWILVVGDVGWRKEQKIFW